MANKTRIPTPVFQTENTEPTPQELADQFAKQAVKSVIAPEPDGLHLLDEMARSIPRQKTVGPGDLRDQIEELDRRITRQEKRVQKIQFNREGPADEMQAVLDDMIKSRDLLQAQLDVSARKDQGS